jgi:8-oxo-dGTP pyrophosphatase MutT (NUDIX family)
MRLLVRIAKIILDKLRPRTTVGVRILLIAEGRILLVKHSYLPQWYLPGGGVDRHEAPIKAIRRELQEEVGVTLKRDPELLGFYYSNQEKRDDYIATYVSFDFSEASTKPKPDLEVIDQQWFALEQLPDDISPATRRRISDYLRRPDFGYHPLSDQW